MKLFYTKTVIITILIILSFGISKASNNFFDNKKLQFTKSEKRAEDPKIISFYDKLLFKIENNKIVLTDKNKFPELQILLNQFYALKNRNLITITKKNISEILNNTNIYNGYKNQFIQFFLYGALGFDINWWNIEISDLEKAHYIAIRKLSENPVSCDKYGYINSTERLFKKIEKQANAVPLDKLLKNPIFAANFQDAENLKGKSLELAGKGDLNKDDKIMFAMEQYYYFKSLTSTVDIQDMRNFLMFMNGDISYRDSNKTTDEFVVQQYLAWAEQFETKMKTKKMRHQKTLE